jgi:predicted ATPase
MAEARRLAHPPTWASSVTGSARLLSLLGDNVALDQRADLMLAVATEHGFPLWHALGTIFRGWVKVRNGDLPEGIPLMSSGLTACRATGAEGNMTAFVALLARGYEMAGQIEEAMIQLNDGLRITEKTGERWLEAELNRHKGELLLRQGQPEAAEELYRKALSTAEKQEAKLWELRASVSLARLWRTQDRRAEARDRLAAVYGWFTEGFDTSDLKEAKSLLDELA